MMKLESKTIRGLTYAYLLVCTTVPPAAVMIYFDLDPESGNFLVNTTVTLLMTGWFFLVAASGDAVERTLKSLLG